MTPAEAAIVLARASGVDGRKHGEAQARVWADILGEVDLADAIRAVDEHYATNEQWMYPVHVIRGAKRIRDKRIGAEKAATLQAAIERDNAGELVDKPVGALTIGKDVPVARYLAQQVAAGRKPASAVDTEAVARDADRRAQARAELDSRRAWSRKCAYCCSAPNADAVCCDDCSTDTHAHCPSWPTCTSADYGRPCDASRATELDSRREETA